MATDIALTNIAANNGKGFFAATRTNCTWNSSSLTPGDGATQSVRVTPSAAGECCLTSGAHDLVASHKYYVTFKIMFTSAVSGTCDWYWPVAEPPAASGLAFNAAANEWVRLSALFTRESFTDGSYPFRWDFNNESVTVPIYFTSCMLLDLTAAFGAGKEPSKEWMDSHLTTFSDAPTLSYYENLGELFTNIANAIRTKDGTTGSIFACDFPERILAAGAAPSQIQAV